VSYINKNNDKVTDTVEGKRSLQQLDILPLATIVTVSGSMEIGMNDTSLYGSELVGLMVGTFVDDLASFEAIQGGGGRDGDGEREERRQRLFVRCRFVSNCDTLERASLK
jgi:hypothetical protein